jgi:membrane fusion protein, multidrug efflux system
MAEPVLRFPADARPKPAGVASRALGAIKRRRRFLLFVVLPAISAVVTTSLYLTGGRYVTTDNAYVGAQKVLVTPDVSGKIGKVVVHEGDRVNAGDVLFEIEREPFVLALQQAQAKLDGVRADFANLRSNDAALSRLIELAQKTVELRRSDVERKTTLATNRTGSQFDLDSSNAALVAAETQVEQLRQQRSAIRNQLLGEVDLPIERFPPFMQAKAVLDQAQRDLNLAVIRAPISGAATQVDNIQIGRSVITGTPILSIIDDTKIWVDANPKETDLTYVKTGQKVTIVVDTFPNQTFRGTLTSMSPGTGAQFAILPPQNASGNWVKVVQRVPLRISFDGDAPNLRSGMSATVSIDTRRTRTLAGLLGLSAPAKDVTP